MPTPTPRKYWFPAKRYGWGWGPPCAWEGWATLAVFLILITAGAFWLTRISVLAYIVYAVVLGGLLFGVCWIKGEPPRWRSGP